MEVVASRIEYSILKDVESICPLIIEYCIFLGYWKYQPPEWTRLLWHWEKHHHFDGLHSSYLYHHTRSVQNVHIMICCGVWFDLKFEWTGTYNVKYMNIFFENGRLIIATWYFGLLAHHLFAYLVSLLEMEYRHEIIFCVWNTSNDHKIGDSFSSPSSHRRFEKKGSSSSCQSFTMVGHTGQQSLVDTRANCPVLNLSGPRP